MQSQVHVHTLGPSGTNCEAAAHHWLDQQRIDDHQVTLYGTLEEAVQVVTTAPGAHVLLGCVVYPDLHHIVFRNLGSLALVECFVMPTHHMVVAGDMSKPVPTVASHPAPVNLLDAWTPEITFVDSNVRAAMAVAGGDADACVTTSIAAAKAGLPVVEDFGPVPMGFSIHANHTYRQQHA
ncbi:hypothetical protein [Micromonospora sp. NPDC049645]|uniref:hypothetical protein n=1 Tax=Micromonospora sp. NPDC049645 TaxID=3155508 RepID=UPI00341F54B2